MAANKELCQCLKVLLADVVTMYFTSHGYHWNVEGSDFAQYHGLFGEIYEDVYSSIDPIAENIRKLDDYAPFTLSDFSSLRTVKNKEVATNPKTMAKALFDMNAKLIASVNKAFKCAVSCDEQGIANFLSERDDMHKKWAWQLKASVK